MTRQSPVLMQTLTRRVLVLYTLAMYWTNQSIASLIKSLYRPTFVKFLLIAAPAVREEIMSKTYKIVVMGGDYSGPEVFFVLQKFRTLLIYLRALSMIGYG